MRLITVAPRRSLRVRFIIGLSLMLGPLLVLAWSTMQSLNQSIRSLDEVAREIIEETQPLYEADKALREVDRSLSRHHHAPEELRKDGSRLFQECDQSFTRLQNANLDDEDERAIVQAAHQKWQEARGLLRSLFELPQPAGDLETARLTSAIQVQIERIEDDLEDALENSRAEILASRQGASDAQRRATATIVSTFALSLLFALLWGLILARSVLVPLAAIEAGARRLGEGELSSRVQVDREDELGRLASVFNSMARKLETQSQQREQAEAALREARDKLEARVQERTAELARTNERLQSAKEEADRANLAKSEFLSRMSHELRTPLNAILGFGQLLEMDELPAKQAEYVLHILKGGRHLLQLINEVLEIARIEAGRMSISPEPVSVNQIMREAFEVVQPLAAQRMVRLALEINAARWPYVYADFQRLKQVLLNLLANAIKYNHEGGRVAFGYEEAPGRLRFTVSDTGPGIDAEKLCKLFTPFERLGAEMSGTEGTGLGLALSKRLVDLMLGQIGVRSTPGEGSTFWVEFAAAAAPANAEAERDSDASLRGSPSARRGAIAPEEKTVVLLYVEDNLSNLKLVQHILSGYAHVRLMVAMQGRRGLDLAQEHRPDVILLDLHLPDMKGDEVLRRLLADERTQKIPVVMLSADATTRQIERLRAEGAKDYLTKPLNVKQFLAVLDANLKEGLRKLS